MHTLKDIYSPQRLRALLVTATLTVSLAIHPSSSGQAQTLDAAPLLLRYQGQLEGNIEELSNTIDCTFDLLDEQSESLFRERDRTVSVIDRRFTVTLGAGVTPLTPDLFIGRVSLFTKCDLNNNGNHEVITTELVGSTPRAAVALSVRGPVETNSIQVNGDEVVSPDGEWIGAVATTGEVNASRLEADEANIIGYLEANRAHFAAVSTAQLAHRLSPMAEPTPLVDESGVWVGPIDFKDMDNDGALDFIELLIGTDPLSAESAPLDENTDGIYDYFQPVYEALVPPLPFDPSSLSHRFDISLTAEDYVTQVTPGEEWAAAQVIFSDQGVLESLAISVSIELSSGIHHLDLTLVTPNGDRYSLLTHTDEPLGELLTSAQYNFSAEQPPLGLDWNDITRLNREPSRDLQGSWSLLVTNYSGDSEIPQIDDFTLNFDYISSNMITFTRDLSLGESRSITDLRDPTEATDAANKRYVDTHINSSNEIFSGIINELQRTLNPTFPQRFTYRSRVFETYDSSASSYFFSGHPELFGGLSTEAWSTAGVTASQLDLSTLDGLLTQEGQGGSNALIINQSFNHNVDQQGFFMVLQVQVENTTVESIDWPIQASLSCKNAVINTSHQKSSIALNGVSIYSTQDELCTTTVVDTSITITLPPEEISDLVFVVAASEPNISNQRRLMFAFTSDSLNLPQGLVYRRRW